MSERQPPVENKMGTMPVNRLLLSMAIPMMISMLVQALYNVVLIIYLMFCICKDFTYCKIISYFILP